MKTLLRVFALVLSFKIANALKEIDDKEKVVSLYGHNPTKKAFEELAKWFLKNNFNFITTENLIEIVNKQKIIERPVWLSFDDGWRDNFTNVLPILEKYKIPATFFISTNPIQTGIFWWTKAHQIKEQLRIENPDYLWEVPNTVRRELPELINENTTKRETLTISELRQLAQCQYVTIGNHTDNHVNCLNCEKQKIIDEIEVANYKIKDWTGSSPKYFAYPGGHRNDDTIQLIKRLDLELGASIEPKLASSKDDIYNFPRTCLKNNPVSLIENIEMALGIRQNYVILLRNIWSKMVMR